MKKRLLTAIGLSATLFLIGCADDQAREQIAATNAQVAQLQQTVGVMGTKVSTQKLIDILNKLDDLQNQINDLNGNIDTLKHDQQEYNQQIQSLQQQIQALQKGNSTQASTTVVPAAVPVASQPVSNDNDSLKAALKQMKARNFPQAIKELKSVITTANDPDIVASATYYLTVAYAANGQFKDSIATGRKFITDNPDNRNVPDAMRTIYISQTQLGMKKSAANTANALIKKYPNSEAAKKVQQQIAK